MPAVAIDGVRRWLLSEAAAGAQHYCCEVTPFFGGLLAVVVSGVFDLIISCWRFLIVRVVWLAVRMPQSPAGDARHECGHLGYLLRNVVRYQVIAKVGTSRWPQELAHKVVCKVSRVIHKLVVNWPTAGCDHRGNSRAERAAGSGNLHR